jgi:hypothetical protein
MNTDLEKVIRGSFADVSLLVGFAVLAKSDKADVSYKTVREAITDLVTMEPDKAIRMLTGLLILDMRHQDAPPKLHPISKN